MPNCLNCGVHLADNSSNCPVCGATVAAQAPSSTPTEAPGYANAYADCQAQTTPAKKKGNKLKVAAAIILILLLLGAYSRIASCIKFQDSLEDWPTGGLADMIPTLNVKCEYAYVHEDSLSLSTERGKLNKQAYSSYVAKCKEMGFTVDAKEGQDRYEAYNADGYRLKASWSDYSERLDVSLDAPLASGVLSWPTSGLATMLPNPGKTKGNIESDSSSYFTAYVGEVTPEEYAAYVDACIGTGFNVEYDRGEDSYYADNAEGYHLSLEYIGYSTMKVSLTAPKDGSVSARTAEDAGANAEAVADEAATSEASEQEADEAGSSDITVTMSADDLVGMLYTDAEAKLREMGFTEFEYETIDTDDINKPDDTVGAVVIGNWLFGKSDFSAGDTFEPDATVTLKYYICDEPDPNLTVSNCPELASILSNAAEIDDSYAAFAAKYKGRIVEFDGSVDYCTNHGDYKTRFDYLLSAGDYDSDHQIGPTFKFDDVSYSDLGTDLDSVGIGQNVHIVAEVLSFDSNTGLFYLEPVSVTGR